MNEFWRSRVIGQLERGDTLEQIDRDLRLVRTLNDDERAALWLLAWGEQQREARAPRTVAGIQANREADRPRPRSSRTPSDDPITATLELARAETTMDLAVLGEIRDGREVVRCLAGDAESFGLRLGASMPIEDTYCARLLAGRLPNIVPNAGANHLVRNHELTRDAPIGAYIGIPLTGLDARLYVLCCLAHEQRPSLSERDLLLLRDLSETLIAALGSTSAR